MSKAKPSQPRLRINSDPAEVTDETDSVTQDQNQGISAEETAAGPTDEMLITRLAAGDATSGEELIDRYHEALMRYLTRLMGSTAAAEDLAQQTWLSIVEHARQFRPGDTGTLGQPTSFRAWMYRIATNKVHDLWRSKGRAKKAYHGLALVTDDASSSAHDQLSHTEEQVRVRQAIDQLPDAQRQIVLLRYYSDMKFVEIANMLGCPLNTALGRMHKAVQKLRGLLDADSNSSEPRMRIAE